MSEDQRDLLGLSGRVALVTGGSQGIGRAGVLALAAAGAKVAIVARRQEVLSAVVADVEALGGEAIALPCDVRQQDEVTDAVAQTATRFGRLDVLVNNAGGSYGDDFERGELLSMTADDAIGVFRMNVVTAFTCARAVVPVMREAGGGSIINVSSVVVKTPMAGFGLYSAAKAALTSLTSSMAIEWAPEIRVNAVLAGHVDTPRAASRRSAGDTEWLQRHIALARLGLPEDIAGGIVYLASDLSRWVTGSALSVDGGVRSL